MLYLMAIFKRLCKINPINCSKMLLKFKYDFGTSITFNEIIFQKLF